jgi:hypothetical protein
MTGVVVSLVASRTAGATTAARATKAAAGTAGARRTGRLAAQIAVALLVVIALVAVVVRVAAAGLVRGWLDFAFAGVPATVPEAARIFAHNAGAMLGIGGLLLIAQLAARRREGPARTQRYLQAAGELLLAGLIAANLAVVGAALGAYGTRMIRAVLPHGPVELAAFALATALYLQGRHRPLAVPHMLATGTASLALLAIAALLEALITA